MCERGGAAVRALAHRRDVTSARSLIGRLAGAGLETFAEEPTDPKNPLIFLDNVICTPHCSALTTDAMIRMGTTAATNIVGYLQRGECDTRNVVNPAVLKK